MSRLGKTGVTVAGAGALGLCLALVLARRGVAVTVRDPAAAGDNASGVAAGMLAPVFECVLDPLAADHLDLFRAARDLWPGFADIRLDRSGAVYRGGHGPEVRARLDRLNVDWRETADGPMTSEDWRLDPVTAMATLRDQAIAAGAAFDPRPLGAPVGGLLIVATGPGSQRLAPELSHLRPIKGHILRFVGGPTDGPVQRADGVYLCPGSIGAVVGATMENGVNNRAIDPAQVAALRGQAEALWPDLAGLAADATTGVRAATPDGLPLVGWSAAPDTLLAVGARRNGWLLAPLVARTIAAYLADEDPGPHAARLDPRRFDTEE